MTAERVLIAGGCSRALSLASALVQHGCRTWLYEPDPDDAARLATMIAKAARGPVCVTRSLDEAGDVDIAIVTRGRAAELAPRIRRGGVVISLAEDDEPGPGVTVLDLAGAGIDPVFVEHWGGPVLPANWVAAVLEVPVTTVPGPITRALRATIEDTAEALVFAGATPWELDETLQATGWTTGPCLMQDAVGLDVAYARHRAQDAAGTRRHAVPLIDRMVPEGRLGRKGGVGWYRYPGGGGPVIDPLVQDLALEEAHFARHPAQDRAPPILRLGIEAALARWAQGMLSRGFEPAGLERAALALGLPRSQMSRALSMPPDLLSARLRSLAADLHPFWTP